MMILLTQESECRAYIFTDDGAKTANPQDARTTNLVDEQPFAAEHGFTKSLTFVLLCDALSRGKEGVFAYVPDFGAVKAEERDIAEGCGSEEDLAWAGVI